MGGLGIKDIKLFNIVLLTKWKWRLVQESQGLWKNIVESKYGSWRSLEEMKSGRVESYWWTDLRQACGLREGNTWFEESVIWRVGSGNRIKFWEDVWIANRPLKEVYPRLYSNTNIKQGTLVDYGKWKDNNWG